MEQRPRIFDILRESNDLAADQALAAGALHVDPEQQCEIIGILLERGHEAGLKALPALHDKLDVSARDLIIANAARLFGVLRSSIRGSVVQTRLNTLEIIRQSGSLRLGYIAAIAIHDGSPSVRAEAATTLQQLADRHYRDYAETTAALRDAAEPDGSTAFASMQALKMLRDERQYLIAAIRDALNNYESHHRPEIVEAAMLFATELEEHLFQQSTLKRGKLIHAMLEIFTTSLSPRLVPFAYIALCYPELRRRIVTALATHQDPAFFAEFIRQRWLAHDPVIRKNLNAIRSLAWFGDGLEAAFSLPDDIAPVTPSWLLSLGLPTDQKVSLLLNFLLIDSLPVNRAAVMALVKTDRPVSTLALQSVLDHEDPALVRSAQLEIEHRAHGQERLLGRPRRDRPEVWSNMLQRAGVSEDFNDLWQHFDRLHPVQARSAGHHAFKYVSGFATHVQVKLLSPHAADRLRALRFMIALHVVDRFQNDVFGMANDSTPEVRATAVAALAFVGDATSRRILERALSDDDPTVQANAIEAFDSIGIKKKAALILPKTDSDEANVRAAATRLLLKMKVPQAALALISMLQDPRGDHRCAALWIVDQLHLSSVAPRVSELEKNDRDMRIARIAQHVGKRLKRRQAASGAAEANPVETIPS